METDRIPDRPVTEVGQFLATLDHPHRPAIVLLREAIVSAHPALVERIKWKAPSYGAPDDRVTFRLAPAPAFQLIFHRGSKARPPGDFVFEDQTGWLRWAAPDRGVLDLASVDVGAVLPDITGLIGDWIEATRDPSPGGERQSPWLANP